MFHSCRSCSDTHRLRQRQQYSHCLWVEPLENRRMLAVMTVDTELDVIDFDDDVTSLREAIFATNILPGADEIVFDFGHDGPAIIRIERGELEITEALAIAGDEPELLTIDAQENSRILNITATTGEFAFAGMTLTILIWQTSFGTSGDSLGSGGGTAGAQLAELSAPGAAQDGLGINSPTGRMLPPSVMAVPPVDASPTSAARPPTRSASIVTPPTLPAISPYAADAWATTQADDAGAGRLPYAPRARATLADVSVRLRSTMDLRPSRFAAGDARDALFAEDNHLLSSSRVSAYEPQR